LLLVGWALISGSAAAQPLSVTSADPASGEQATGGLIVKIKDKSFAGG